MVESLRKRLLTMTVQQEEKLPHARKDVAANAQLERVPQEVTDLSRLGATTLRGPWPDTRF